MSSEEQTEAPAVPSPKKTIRFRARSFFAFALAPEAPLKDWWKELDNWTASSPGFFSGRPVVLDLTVLKPRLSEVRKLVSQLADRGIRVYAIQAENMEGLDPDLPPLLVGAKATVVEEEQPEEKVAEAEDKAEAEAVVEPVLPVVEAKFTPSLIIRSPVRSGQSIFQPEGDVIVIGAVGSGSEIIAGGSVHVYGTLRGRVFAGAMGNPDARIFCRKNEAELLAVDGCYRTADDMEPSSRGKPIQAFLEDGVVQVAALN